jgi:plastocyanin
MRFNEYYFDEIELAEKITSDTEVGKPIAKAVGSFFRSLGLGKKTEAVNMNSLKYKQIVTIEDLNQIQNKFIQPLRDPSGKDIYIKNVYNLKPVGDIVSQFKDILSKIPGFNKNNKTKDKETDTSTPEATPDTNKESYELYVVDYLSEASDTENEPHTFTGGAVYKTNHGGRIVLMNLRKNDEDVHILAADEKGNDLFRKNGYTFNSLISSLKSGQKGKFNPETVEVGDLVTFKFKGGSTKDFYVFKIDKDNKKFMVTSKEEDRNGDHDGIEVKSNIGDGNGLPFDSASAIKEAGASSEKKIVDGMTKPENVEPGDEILYNLHGGSQQVNAVITDWKMKTNAKNKSLKDSWIGSGKDSKGKDVTIPGAHFVEILNKGSGNKKGLSGDNVTSNTEEEPTNLGDNPDLQTSAAPDTNEKDMTKIENVTVGDLVKFTNDKDPHYVYYIKKDPKTDEPTFYATKDESKRSLNKDDNGEAGFKFKANQFEKIQEKGNIDVDKGKLNGTIAITGKSQWDQLVKEFDTYMKDKNSVIKFTKTKQDNAGDEKKYLSHIYTTEDGNKVMISYDTTNDANATIYFSNEKFFRQLGQEDLLNAMIGAGNANGTLSSIKNSFDKITWYGPAKSKTEPEAEPTQQNQSYELYIDDYLTEFIKNYK